MNPALFPEIEHAIDAVRTNIRYQNVRGNRPVHGSGRSSAGRPGGAIFYGFVSK